VTAAQTQRRPAAESDRHFSMLIGGEWVQSVTGKTFRCVDPFTEEEWGHVPRADAEDVDRAVVAARRAFETGPWPAMVAQQRAALLRKLGSLIEQHRAPARQQVWRTDD
jgi:acyl-CoA reductase-like NAD-dependent aldehyde dehydrogenase